MNKGLSCWKYFLTEVNVLVKTGITDISVIIIRYTGPVGKEGFSYVGNDYWSGIRAVNERTGCV